MQHEIIITIEEQRGSKETFFKTFFCCSPVSCSTPTRSSFAMSHTFVLSDLVLHGQRQVVQAGRSDPFLKLRRRVQWRSAASCRSARPRVQHFQSCGQRDNFFLLATDATH